ncbi:unnamed protein product [Somion occarium]|uniref:F-box domain-containing protein n=1 Tax=Somion occarium TaxID=3059160 RepID=A0ABP1E363_9APHY
MTTSIVFSNEYPDVVAKARRELEDGIAKHNRTIIDMKVHLNQLTPISRLPPELLSEIFWFHMVSICHSPNHYLTCQDAWIKVTHVCHYWREVALHSPRLWTRISVSGLDSGRAGELISRSKNASLTVRAVAYNPGNVSALKHVFSHLERIESLDSSLPSDLYKQLFEVPPLSAPRLKKVLFFNMSSLDEEFLPSLKNCHFPSIREAVEAGIPDAMATDVTETARALASMPLLEYLELVGVIRGLNGTFSALPPPSQNVILPRLKTVRLCSSLTSPGAAYAYLLDHLSLPADSRIALDFASSALADIFPLIVDPISHKLTAEGRLGHPGEIRAFAILTHLEHCASGCVLNFWTSVDPVVNPSDRTLPHLQIALPWSANLCQSTWRLCSALPLANIEALWLGCSPGQEPSGATEQIWFDLFKQLTQVTSLRISNQGAVGLPRLLYTRFTSDRPRDNEKYDCPQLLMRKLRSLTLEEVRFRDAEDRDDEFLTDLKDTLRWRESVRELSLRRCLNMDARDVDDLRGIVPSVVWDEVTRWEQPRNPYRRYANHFLDDLDDIELYPFLSDEDGEYDYDDDPYPGYLAEY